MAVKIIWPLFNCYLLLMSCNRQIFWTSQWRIIYDDNMMIIWCLYDDNMMIIWWIYDDLIMGKMLGRRCCRGLRCFSYCFKCKGERNNRWENHHHHICFCFDSFNILAPKALHYSIREFIHLFCWLTSMYQSMYQPQTNYKRHRDPRWGWSWGTLPTQPPTSGWSLHICFVGKFCMKNLYP